MIEIEIECEDGRMLAAHWHRSTNPIPAKATVVVHSATGVKRGYYQSFAQYLSGHGVDVLLWDARGIGGSATQSVRNDPAMLRHWGEHDQQAALAYVQGEHPARPVVIIGHSSGGNLSGLAPLTANADAIILVASGGCDWRDYPPLQRIKMLVVWRLAMPVVLALWGYLPAWSGIGHALPKGVAAEWRKWCLTRGYLWNDPTLDSSGYKAFSGPLLALSISDDSGYAPPGCVQSLLREFSNASIEHHEVPATSGHNGRIGHFGFFKSKNESLWPQVTQWLHGRGLCNEMVAD